MMIIDPSLLGAHVQIQTNEATQALGWSGLYGDVVGAGWESDRRGTYALFLVETSAGFLTVEGSNIKRVPRSSSSAPFPIPSPTASTTGVTTQ